MTIPDSLAAIARADPELVKRDGEVWILYKGRRPWVSYNPRFHTEEGAHLLLWAFKTAARKGLDCAVAQVAGEYAGVCGPRRSEGHADPTAAALAALAAALTEEATP